MIIIKKVKPVFTKILTTAYKYVTDVKENGVVVITKGTLMEYQKIVEVGNSVRNVKIGDLVKINPSRYAIKKHDDNSVRNDLGMNPIVGYNFPMIHIQDGTANGNKYMMLDEQDVEYIVSDYLETKDVDIKKSNLIIPDNTIIS